MPVAKRGERGGRQAALVALGATAGMVAVIFLVSRNANLIGGSSGGGSGLFGAGSVFTAPAEALADTIADSGPTILPDIASRDRDIILQHLGDEPDAGWYAFSARPLESDRSCIVEWTIDAAVDDGGLFVDSCNGDQYPADGEGLTQYPTSVDADGTLSVDLNAAERTSSPEEEE